MNQQLCYKRANNLIYLRQDRDCLLSIVLSYIIPSHVSRSVPVAVLHDE